MVPIGKRELKLVWTRFLHRRVETWLQNQSGLAR